MAPREPRHPSRRGLSLAVLLLAARGAWAAQGSNNSAPAPYYPRSTQSNQSMGAINQNFADITGRNRDKNVPIVGDQDCSLIPNGALIGATEKGGYIFGGTCQTVATSSSSPVGVGSTNYVTKWTSNLSLGNSLIYDNGSQLGVGTGSPAALRFVDFVTSQIDGYAARFNNTTGVRGHGLEVITGATDRTAWGLNVNSNNARIFGDGSAHFAGGTDIAGLTVSNASATVQGNLQVKGPNPWVDVQAYGAVADDATDNSTALQNAFNQQGRIFIPAGTYRFSTTLNVPLNTVIECQDKVNTVLRYTGTGAALSNSQAINGSGYGRVTIRNCNLKSTQFAKTGIELLAGGFAYYIIEGNEIGANFNNSVVCDQCEVSAFMSNIFENNPSTYSTCMWITSGPEYRRAAGEFAGFSNRIWVANNQLNGCAYGLVDDGGSNHTIAFNNFNGSSISIRMAGVTPFTIMDNEIEAPGISKSTTSGILFTDLGFNNGTSATGASLYKGVCQGGEIANNFMGADGATGGAEIVFQSTGANHIGISSHGNWFRNNTGISVGNYDLTKLSSATIGPDYHSNAIGMNSPTFEVLGPLQVFGGSAGTVLFGFSGAAATAGRFADVEWNVIDNYAMRIANTNGVRGHALDLTTGDNSTTGSRALDVNAGNAYIYGNGAAFFGGFIQTQSTITVAGNAFSVGGSTFVVLAGQVGIGTLAPAGSRMFDVEATGSLYSDGYAARFSNATGVRGHGIDIVTGATDRTAWGISVNGNSKIYADGSAHFATGTDIAGLTVTNASATVQGNLLVNNGGNFSVTSGSATILYGVTAGSLTINGAQGYIITQSSIVASAFVGNGALITGIVSAGLPSDVAYTDKANTFSSSNTINAAQRFTGNIEIASATVTFDGAGSYIVAPLGINIVPTDTMEIKTNAGATVKIGTSVPAVTTGWEGQFATLKTTSSWVQFSRDSDGLYVHGIGAFGDGNNDIFAVIFKDRMLFAPFHSTTTMTLNGANVGIGIDVPKFKLDTNSYEQVTNSCTTVTSCTATCSAGKQVLGGGCTGATSTLADSAAGSKTTWVCTITLGNVTAQAICLNEN